MIAHCASLHYLLKGGCMPSAPLKSSDRATCFDLASAA